MAAYRAALLALLPALLLAQSASAAENRNVLVLYSNNRLVPGNVAVDRGLRAEISSPIGERHENAGGQALASARD